ncbi:hypothetical protein [Nocardia vaccinii]|uniref:hypothetical protein n=1 Tax=Nocardia vaccinii TaxID=1822 RepID=UPI000830D691|nr:hypothetical protein [Nocardia vaccinii]
MTRSDSEEPDPGQDNPFDLGLPMLRPPERQPSRRRPGRRGTRRRRPPPARPAPMPIPGTADRSGDWEEWLDQGARQPDPPPEAPAERTPVREYDYSDDDGPVRVPQIVDRSGGSAGSRLRRARSRRADDRRRRDKVLSLLILVGVGIVIVSVVLTVLHTGNRKHNTTAAASVPAVVEDSAPRVTPPMTAAASPAPIATADCEQRRDADEVSGTDPGGTSSGPDAILAFERAYYVQRSGSAARAVVTDDATVSSASSGPSAFPAAESIQRGINQVPVGTRYCVQVTRGSSDGSQWEVRLTQQKPGEQPHTFTQIVSTRTIADRTLISAIKEG